eukprot:1728256-Prymnesium_polylepis.1
MAVRTAQAERLLEQKLKRLQEEFERKWRLTNQSELERRVFAAYREANLPASSLFRVELVKSDADLTPEGFSSHRASDVMQPCHNRLLCMIPGVEGTAWAGGCFPLLITFDHLDPLKPPRCYFPAHEGPGAKRTEPLNEAVLRSCREGHQQTMLQASRPNGFMHTNIYPSGL